jgi:anti-anti-sigma factor
MDIEQRQAGDSLELVIGGRLDSYWADHLTARMNQVIQQGHHHLRLNLAATSYLSSAGIGVLVQFYRQLRGIDGSFLIVEPSPQVEKILGIAGLTQLLLTPDAAPAKAAAAADEARKVELRGVRYEVFSNAPGETLSFRVIGEPELLRGCRFSEEHGSTIPFPQSGFALGLGAIGPDFVSCRERYGEFLTVAGAAAYLPADGTNTPDYLVSAGSGAPDLSVLYGLECRGNFSQLARFEAANERGAATLSNLADSLLNIAGAKAAGMVVVAESNGLIGAALRRSPAGKAGEGAPFAFPGIREWLSFTPERVYRNSVAVLVGVVQREGENALNGMARPLGGGTTVSGHFHAAVFTYGPLQRGRIEMRAAVTKLFEAEKLQTVLHLLNDDRPISGAGESEFTRGACWIGPLAPAAGKGESQ